MKDFREYVRKRVNIENCIMKPIEPDDMDNDRMIDIYIAGMFELFSNEDVYRWNSSVKLLNLEAAKERLKGQLLNILDGTGEDYTYWIFEKISDKPHRLIGNIHLYPYPEVIRTGRGENYSWMKEYLSGIIEEAWFIEFYIHPEYAGRGICTSFSSFIINNLFEQGYSIAVALVNRRNYSSVKVLENIGFRVNLDHKKKAELQNINERFYTLFNPKKNNNVSVDKELKTGKVNFPDGNIYLGTIYESKLNGRGTTFYRNGEKYEGEYLDDKRHGKGIYSYPDGEFYEGEFVNGKYEGKGKYVYADGRYYVGEFEDDLFHGKGAIYSKDGQIIRKGVWENDHLVFDELDYFG